MATTPNHLLRHSYMEYIHLSNVYRTARSGAQHTICDEFNTLSASLKDHILELISLTLTGARYLHTEIGTLLSQREPRVNVVTSLLPLQQVIQKIAFDAFDHLPTSEANFVAGRMYANCGSPPTQDLQWGTHHVKDEDKVEELLRSLTDNAANELENCTHCAQPFIEGLISISLKTSILESIQKLPSDQRADILAHAQDLIAYLRAPADQVRSSIGNLSVSNYNLLYAIAAIPQDKRAVFLEDIKLLLRDADHLLQQDFNGYILNDISTLLSKATAALLHERASWSLPQEQRAVIFNKIAQVLLFNGRSYILDELRLEGWNIMTQDLEREAHPIFLLQLLDLIAEEPFLLKRTTVFGVILQAKSLTLLDAIRAMPSSERQKLLHILDLGSSDQAIKMVRCIMAMPAQERMDIIALLGTIPDDLRVHVVTCLDTFSREERKVFLAILEKIKAGSSRRHVQNLINISQLTEENRLNKLFVLLEAYTHR